MKTNRTPSSGSRTLSVQDISLPAWLSRVAYKSSVPKTSKKRRKRISSPASALGRTRSGSRGGQTASRCGQGRALVSRSRQQDVAKDSKTNGISGRRGSSSSASADLASSLGSRLRALTASGGSTLFSMTWKERVTPSGRVICALRASVPRTSGNGCTSWPSPVSNDAKGSAYTYAQGNHDRPSLKLLGAARLASWATPAAREAGGTPEQFLERKRKANRNGSSLGVSLTSLSLQATLASWATPAARDHRSDRGQKSDSEQYGTKGRPLPRQALLLDSGKKRSGGSAKTAKSAQLNPAHSRWLMGLPRAWDACAPTEMPSSRSKRRSSSGRRHR
jgi:hypothetical protein